MARNTHRASVSVGRVRVAGILRKAYDSLVNRDPVVLNQTFGPLHDLPTDPGALLTLAARERLHPDGKTHYGDLAAYFKTDPRDVAHVTALLLENFPLDRESVPYKDGMAILRRVMEEWQTTVSPVVSRHRDTTIYQTPRSYPTEAQRKAWKEEERQASSPRAVPTGKITQHKSNALRRMEAYGF